MSEYEHGSMNVSEQEKTFHGFIKAAIYVAAASIAVLILMALLNA